MQTIYILIARVQERKMVKQARDSKELTRRNNNEIKIQIFSKEVDETVVNRTPLMI